MDLPSLRGGRRMLRVIEQPLVFHWLLARGGLRWPGRHPCAVPRPGSTVLQLVRPLLPVRLRRHQRRECQAGQPGRLARRRRIRRHRCRRGTVPVAGERQRAVHWRRRPRLRWRCKRQLHDHQYRLQRRRRRRGLLVHQWKPFSLHIILFCQRHGVRRG